METIRSTYTLSDDGEVFSLLAGRSEGRDSDPEPFDADGLAMILWELDAAERPTGRIAGVEIVGLWDFSDWDAIPDLPLRWQLPGWPALSLAEVLRRIQPIALDRHRTPRPALTGASRSG
ncbi:MAG TPA: hypothetical protein VKU87_11665 [Thermomicrobiaceae bacterium]|nr:hypothetical protein [Thermomicrobiaceae bacterium]